MISIVLPVFNGAKYLAEAIESCLGQTHRDLELIIVDDASTDATPKIIRHYEALDPRIRTATHDQNKRLAGALNTGLRIARGGLISWTSDDNRYRATALEVLHERLLASGADIVYSDYTVLTVPEGTSKRVLKEGIEWLPQFNCVGACFLFRRSVAETVGRYRVEYDGAEDYDYWLRALDAGFRFTQVRRDLYVYRTHDSSLTASLGERVHTAALRARFDFLRRTKVLPRNELADELLDVAYQALKHNQWDLALGGAIRSSASRVFARPRG